MKNVPEPDPTRWGEIRGVLADQTDLKWALDEQGDEIETLKNRIYSLEHPE